ncbi:hypothetical protein K457DRAFT_25588 [Linnemannia elongata AG-77]|uniref:Phosphatidylglycerol/phosphatidylinositol transfer protein n=1 Tax=Linnemannia elongata AG-77 TaxID=1314771 RepID=A0A197JCT7_9FUNG|nr:hypothetical protein K457DRAFT_25588 [Linnemannia elongata AG-77]
MKLIATTAALATAAAIVSAELPHPGNFSSCASGPTQLALDSFTLSPSPMCIGKEFCYTATGTLNTAIVEGGTLSIMGRFLGRLIYTDNADLCDALAAGGHKDCAIPAGPVTLKMCRILRPNFPPNWKTSFQVAAVSGDGGTLFCQAETNYAVQC